MACPAAPQAMPMWLGLLEQLRQEFEQLQARNEELAAQNSEQGALLQHGHHANLAVESRAEQSHQELGICFVSDQDSFLKQGQNEHLEAESGASPVAAADTMRTSACTASGIIIDMDHPEAGTEEIVRVKRFQSSQCIHTDRVFKTEFKRLCDHGRTSVSAENLHNMRVKQVPQSLALPQSLASRSRWRAGGAIAAYREALRSLNTEISKSVADASIDPDSLEEMQLDTYIALFESKGWARRSFADKMPIEHKSVLHQICQVVMNHAMMRDISEITGVDMAMLWVRHTLSFEEKCMQALEFLSSALIMLNIITLTLSLDVHSDWPGWQRIELVFTACFTIEMCMRLGLAGMRKHFCGRDCGWNIFDLMVVVLGILDALLSATGVISSGAPQINIIRVLRLLRTAKMVRVLRLKIFRELKLIVAGLFGGLMTIVWGIVFLFFFILMLGIMTKQFLSVQPEEPLCEDLPWGCSDSQLHLEKYRSELFGSVPRCMFTIFRCFVSDGCSSIDGTPLVPFLWDQYGIFICIFYVFIFLFLTFGLYNNVMANIVESTMEAAANDDAKKYRHNKKEHLKVALAVKDLVRALCAAEDEEPPRLEASNTIDTIKTQIFGSPWWAADHASVQVMLKSRISTKELLENLQTKRVRDLLEKLGITTADPSSYIDALDANGDGSLSIPELVRGLLKMRGQVDKADIIAGLMATRDVQKSLKSIEAKIVRFGSNTSDGAIVTRPNWG